jgi:hypothetical protein
MINNKNNRYKKDRSLDAIHPHSFFFPFLFITYTPLIYYQTPLPNMPFDIYVAERPRRLAIVPRGHDIGPYPYMLILEHRRDLDNKGAVMCECTIVPSNSKNLSPFIAPLNRVPIVGLIGLLDSGMGKYSFFHPFQS